MQTEKIKVIDLEIGDKVIRDSDEEILTVSKIIQKGFHYQSVFIEYKEGGWSSAPTSAKIKIVKK